MGLPLGCGTKHHLVAVPRFFQRPLLVGLAGLQRAALIDAVAQYQQRLGNRADFIATVGELDIRRAVTIGDAPHALADEIDRPGHAAHDGCGHADNQKAGHDTKTAIKIDVAPEHRFKIVNINTGADNPSPGGETGDMGEFLDRLRRTGLRPVIIDKALAACLDRIHELDEQRRAVHLGLDRMHHHFRMHVVDPEIAAAIAVAHCRNGRLGLLLRRLPRQASALLQPVILIENGNSGFVHCRKPGFPFALHFVVAFKQAECESRGQYCQKQCDERIQAHRYCYVFHVPPQRR
ncbi:hypothetical protein D3C72_999760 [compost metagenome]